MHRALASFSFALIGVASAAAQCTNVSVPGGSGCGMFTPWGIPVVSCSGSPTIGNASFGFETSAVCFGGTPIAGFLVAGSCLPSPVLLTNQGPGGFCGPSQAVCALFISPDVTIQGAPTGFGFTFPVPVPNSPQLVGAQLCVQGVSVCTTGPCISVSNAVSVTVL